MSHELKMVADELGFDYCPVVGTDVQYGIESTLSGYTLVRLSDVLEKRSDGVRILIATLQYQSDSDSSSTSRTLRQTVVYYQQAGLKLPSFALEPKNLTGKLLTGVLGFMGVPMVDLSADPEVDRTSIAMSLQPEATRRLLTSEVLAEIRDWPDLTIRAGEHGLLVYRKGQVLEPDRLASFLAEAHDIIATLVRRARELPDLADASRQEALHTMRNFGGPIGSALRGALISQSEIDSFLDQSPPRQIPPAIRRQRLGFGSLFFYIWGGMFFVIGTAVVGGLAASGEIPPWVTALLGLVPLMGLTAVVLTWRYRRTQRRLLRDGDCREAVIEDVQPTNTYINGQRRYTVTFRIPSEGAGETHVMNAYEPAVRKAFDLQASGETTRVLIDPVNLRRVLWIDSLAIV